MFGASAQQCTLYNVHKHRARLMRRELFGTGWYGARPTPTRRRLKTLSLHTAWPLVAGSSWKGRGSLKGIAWYLKQGCRIRHALNPILASIPIQMLETRCSTHSTRSHTRNKQTSAPHIQPAALESTYLVGVTFGKPEWCAF